MNNAKLTVKFKRENHIPVFFPKFLDDAVKSLLISNKSEIQNNQDLTKWNISDNNCLSTTPFAIFSLRLLIQFFESPTRSDNFVDWLES